MERIEGNEALRKIETFKKVKTDSINWKEYYWDEITDEFWVLEYPDSEYHGGGIPVLTKIDKPPDL